MNKKHLIITILVCLIIPLLILGKCKSSCEFVPKAVAQDKVEVKKQSTQTVPITQYLELEKEKDFYTKEYMNQKIHITNLETANKTLNSIVISIIGDKRNIPAVTTMAELDSVLGLYTVNRNLK